MIKNKKIKIGGIIYIIQLGEDLSDSKCGRLDREKNIIFIDKNLSKDQQELTLLHEILHAINGELDEEIVDGLTVSLHQVIKDNQFKY